MQKSPANSVKHTKPFSNLFTIQYSYDAYITNLKFISLAQFSNIASLISRCVPLLKSAEMEESAQARAG